MCECVCVFVSVGVSGVCLGIDESAVSRCVVIGSLWGCVALFSYVVELVSKKGGGL